MKHIYRNENIKNRLSIITDVVYAQHYSYDGLRQLTMDLILPDIVRDPTGRITEHNGKSPVVIYVVGGGFKTTFKDRWLPSLCYFAQNGFAVASVEYRTSNEALFPAALEDVKSAVRYLRQFSDKFGLDEKNIFIMGDSAGAYLALMTGLTGDSGLFENEAWKGKSDAVNAVCDWFGPINVMNEEEDVLCPTRLFLGPRNPKEYKAANPLAYINKDSVPVLIFHRTADQMINFSDSEMLHDAMEKVGARTQLYTVEGAGHNTIEFGQEPMMKIITDFFVSYMK